MVRYAPTKLWIGPPDSSSLKPIVYHPDVSSGWPMDIDVAKQRVRTIGAQYQDRELRARRLFIEERAACLEAEREREFAIRAEISQFFEISHTGVCFSGSAQLGFSIHKNKLFERCVSDLDVACIDVGLFQAAWIDVISTTRAFTDLTPFGSRGSRQIEYFKEALLRRGMIRVDAMPLSKNSRRWSQFQGSLSRKHASMFRNINLAIYMSEYAFCWKQDSSLSNLLG